MLRLKKIAITGGVASGKSSVCQLLKELGAYVVSADAIVHQLLTSESDFSRQVISRFGPEIVKNGQISRKALAEKVFQDEKQLKWLEKLLHPAVLQKIEAQYAEACEQEGYLAFVVEIPLLFEIGAERFFDLSIGVIADEALAKERFRQAGFLNTEYDLRMSRQLSPKMKAMKSHYVIQNNGSLDDLRREVIRINHLIQNP